MRKVIRGLKWECLKGWFLLGGFEEIFILR